jgi:hypothetical protein
MDPFHSFLAKVEVALINPIITLLGLAAFALFVFGIVEFVGGAGNEEKRSIGQRHMIWGFIGLTIMFGAKAIIAIMASSIGVSVP